MSNSPSARTAAPALNFNTAYDTLLAPYELNDAKLSNVFGQILAHQVDYADVYFQYTRSESWSLEEGIVKSGSFNIEQGVGVRAVSSEKTAFAYSDDISLQALKDAASATRATCPSTTGRPPEVFTTTDSRSAVDWIRPSERTSISLAPWFR